ncbi:hypothetical protein ABPG72_016509 [Tetrahymena utriculariae]
MILSQDISQKKDFNSKYSNGEIYIEDNFQYQVSSFIFICPDSPILQYTAKIKKGEQFVNIPKDAWIQFSPTDRVFTGNTATYLYNYHIVIQVNTTDGYSFSIDEFTIIPNRVPFSYTFQLALQIFSPLFGLLGLYKYKHIIYNLSFKKHYIYTKDVAYVGEVFQKQIIITDNVRKQAQQLFTFLRKVQERVKFCIRYLKNQQKIIKFQVLSTLVLKHKNRNFKIQRQIKDQVLKRRE